jgi:hypothetical protein
MIVQVYNAFLRIICDNFTGGNISIKDTKGHIGRLQWRHGGPSKSLFRSRIVCSSRKETNGLDVIPLKGSISHPRHGMYALHGSSFSGVLNRIPLNSGRRSGKVVLGPYMEPASGLDGIFFFAQPKTATSSRPKTIAR